MSPGQKGDLILTPCNQVEDRWEEPALCILFAPHTLCVQAGPPLAGHNKGHK